MPRARSITSGCSFSEVQNRFAYSGPDLRPEPHVEAQHVDLAVPRQQFGQLRAMPRHHAIDLFRRGVGNGDQQVSKAFLGGFEIPGQDVRGRHLQRMIDIGPEVASYQSGCEK